MFISEISIVSCNTLLSVFQMSIGEVAKLTCSPDYAYGPQGVAGVYPLLFDYEATFCYGSLSSFIYLSTHTLKCMS